MAKKKKPNNHKPSKRWTKYKIESDKLVKSANCPKCGPGIFFGEHKNRAYCGLCRYTTFESKK